MNVIGLVRFWGKNDRGPRLFIDCAISEKHPITQHTEAVRPCECASDPRVGGAAGAAAAK